TGLSGVFRILLRIWVIASLCASVNFAVAWTRFTIPEAHRRARRAGTDATDDAMLLEAAGYRVAAVEGEPANFKITTQEDLLRAEFVLGLQNAPVVPERRR